MNAHEVARGLGFFSIALGLAELLAPRKLAQAIGINDDHDTLIRSFGARELASGFALLSGLRTKESVWSRVAGDAVDLAALAAAYRSPRNDARKIGAAMLAVAGVTALDVATGLSITRGPAADPSWRYVPAGGLAGIQRRGKAAASVLAEPRQSAPAAAPLELAEEPQTAEPLR